MKDILDVVEHIVAERIPFNRILGIQVISLHSDQVAMKFDMRPELIGNYLRGTLHGGVISATLDLAGGIAAFISNINKVKSDSLEAKVERFARLGTIDLRIDYLRPGLGQSFVATAYILRSGNKVAVTRMELHNDLKELIAVGTAAYVIA